MARAGPKQAAAITGGQTADLRHRGNQGTKHNMCVGEPDTIPLLLLILVITREL
jgi:hypothetical protein